MTISMKILLRNKTLIHPTGHQMNKDMTWNEWQQNHLTHEVHHLLHVVSLFFQWPTHCGTFSQSATMIWFRCLNCDHTGQLKLAENELFWKYQLDSTFPTDAVYFMIRQHFFFAASMSHDLYQFISALDSYFCSNFFMHHVLIHGHCHARLWLIEFSSVEEWGDSCFLAQLFWWQHCPRNWVTCLWHCSRQFFFSLSDMINEKYESQQQLDKTWKFLIQHP